MMKSRSPLPYVLAALVSGSTLYAQGPLTPPGPPAPSMKTLDQIEARTPISSLPFTIDESGSYYLTKDLLFTETSGDAITVQSGAVTLDLNGFTISSTAEANGVAINILGAVQAVRIINGHILGTTRVAVTSNSWTVDTGGFSRGINVSSPESVCEISQITVRGCAREGIFGNGRLVVRNVMATQNGQTGISTGKNSSASGNQIQHCHALLNGRSGIDVTNGSVSHCLANANQAIGIYALQGSVTACTTVSNGSSGIRADHSTVSGCSTSFNGQEGIYASNGSVTNCLAFSNQKEGILAYNGVVAFCTATRNDSGGDDIDAVEGTRTGNNPSP